MQCKWSMEYFSQLYIVNHRSTYRYDFINLFNFFCTFQKWFLFAISDLISREKKMFISGRCPLINGALPKVVNGILSNTANVKLYSFTTADGYYDIQCQVGFTLDKYIGGRITCLPSGSWSPLPQCRCTLAYCSIDNHTYYCFSDGQMLDSCSFYVSSNNAWCSSDSTR